MIFSPFPNDNNNRNLERKLNCNMVKKTSITLFIIIFFLLLTTVRTDAVQKKDLVSIIIEVEGDPYEHKQFIETYYPFAEVVATYDKLFNGLAIRATPDQLKKLTSVNFIKTVHAVQAYESVYDHVLNILRKNQSDNIVFPHEINDTEYTGKDVKVAVIDTGIDYTHPDLSQNYVSGYDLVDLDDDPMETLPSEGVPTLHGTHVAGIIAANGNITGVAPDAKLYAYRALGPGGKGTSIQIIAALEQAVKDGVDIINLSLGNTVNGPDFPTSVAVNKAVDLGVAVVIANGNSGPHNWTVGAPATASNALAVGATRNEQFIPHLYDQLSRKKIHLNVMDGSKPWDMERDYEVVDLDHTHENVVGKIALVERGEKTFHELATQAERLGAVALLIYNDEEGEFLGSIAHEDDPISVPVASITMKDGHWLRAQLKDESYFIQTVFQKQQSGIASFSSRGPVTNSWEIKPDILAPGTNIISTIPNGYEVLQGTSMAAPHVTGAIAVMKEANPDWTNDQIINSLKTTAKQMITENEKPIVPNVQGMGKIQLSEATTATTLIDDPLLAFGKVNHFKERKTIELKIENEANERKKFHFNPPKKQRGISWKLPMTFHIEANSSKIIEISIDTTTSLLEEGIHQGWLTLSDDSRTYELPYLFINQTAEYPKAMGFSFTMKPFSNESYRYQVYVTEQVERLDVQLYDADTLLYDRNLLQLNHLNVGLNEGEITKAKTGKRGHYKAVITVVLSSGEYESYETELYID